MLVDSHVHLYPCFETRAFLDGAAEAFARAADTSGVVAWTGCLLLTETARDSAFKSLAQRVGGRIAQRWICRAGVEAECLHFQRDDGVELLVVSGWQVVTRENLEVLALGTATRIADGQPIEAVIRRCHELGAVAVVPWGFGKWWFGRGRILRRLICSGDVGRILLGDNGGRPALSPRPGAFRIAEQRGIRVIPGTDPLPFASETTRAGVYCFALPDWRDTERPVAALKARLLSMEISPRILGRGESLLRFATLQVRMQTRKFGRRSAA